MGGVQYTMDQGFDIPWISGSKYHGYRVQYSMCRWLYLPLVEGSIYHGYVFQYTMDRGSKYHG